MSRLPLRPARAGDAAAIHRLVRRIEVSDRIPLVTPVEELEEWASDPHFSFAADSRVAEQEGEIVAWGRLWHRPSDSLHSRVFMLGGVDPGWRRRGIGGALFGWQLERGAAILGASPPHLRRFLRTQAYDFETGAIALYERHGLEPTRYVDELVRPLDDLEPIPRPDGVAILPLDVSRSEELRVLHNDGFSDQWSTTPLDREAWEHRMAATGMRFDLSFMAERDGGLIALAMNGNFPDDEQVTGRRDGWIRSLATRRDHRRRGIGSALLIASCHAFRRAGLSHAMLGVDSDNPSGAYRLYEQVGFRRLHRMIQHQREVGAEGHAQR